MGKRKVVYHDSTEESSEEDTRNNFVLAFGGLTISQLESNAVSPAGTSKFRFRFSGHEKAKVLQHLVKHAYTDKIPPTTDVFLELATDIMPVPRDLAMTQLCVESLQRLVKSVTKAAEASGLICTEDRGNGNWEVYVARPLHEWTGAGGWQAITLPEDNKKSLLHGTDGGTKLVYRQIVEDSESKVVWSRLVASAMDHFARHTTPRNHTTETGSGLPPVTSLTRARTAHYVPSSYTTKSPAQQEAQRQSHRVLKRYLRRVQASEAAPDGEALPLPAKATLEWNYGGVDFVHGHDYCHWQEEMTQGNKLIMEDLIHSDSERVVKQDQAP